MYADIFILECSKGRNYNKAQSLLRRMIRGEDHFHIRDLQISVNNENNRR